MEAVDYEEAKDWSEGLSVRKAIVIDPQNCTRERLRPLANHLSPRYVLNPVVVINVFDDGTAARTYDQQLRDDEQKEFALAHWQARYLKSWPVGLNELVLYAGCDHHKPDRLSF